MNTLPCQPYDGLSRMDGTQIASRKVSDMHQRAHALALALATQARIQHHQL